MFRIHVRPESENYLGDIKDRINTRRRVGKLGGYHDLSQVSDDEFRDYLAKAPSAQHA